MKTMIEVHMQTNRIYTLLQQTTSAAIKRAHPETGGSLHLAHNWGNEETRKHLDQYHNRSSKIFSLSQAAHKEAWKREYQ